MTKRRWIIVICAVGAIAALLFLRAPSAQSSLSTGVIDEGPFAVVSTYEGTIESRNTESVMSDLGTAALAWIEAEGKAVKAGDVLVRFGASEIESKLFTLEADHARAESDIESLEKATLPLELRDLEVALLEKETTLKAEQQFLKDTKELAGDGLMATEQVQAQELIVRRAEGDLASIRMKLDLTGKHLHPASLKRARAALATAKRALKQGREQLEGTTVRAPADGIVMYKPLHIGTEFRTVRIGDTVYQNQPFMVIPDMSNLVVHSYIPEAELSRVDVGSDVMVTPAAYPGMRLTGKVESLGSMAQPVSWRPNWQKFFRVTIALDRSDSRLRPGMSAYVYVASYTAETALLAPRSAVSWKKNKPYARVVIRGGRHETRELVVGRANDTHYEVVSGLKSGDRVVLD